MKWNQFLGEVLIGLDFGIMVGAAIGPGSPEKVTTGTAGFCAMLVMTGVAAVRRSLLKGTANEPAPDAAGPGLDNKTPPAH